MEKKMTQVKGILIVSMLACASLVAIIAVAPIYKGGYTYTLNTFQNYNDLLAFFQKKYQENLPSSTHYNNGPLVAFEKDGAMDAVRTSQQSGGATVDYSKTNVQVEGVDEPDIVKTDGTYLYIVANQKVYIVKAYPAEEATVLSVITVESNISITNIFIHNDRLVIFGNTNFYPILYDSYTKDSSIVQGSYISSWAGTSKAIMNVYDVSDRQHPTLMKDVKIDGNYVDARMINAYVYMVATEYTYNIYGTLDGVNVTLDVPEITIDNETQNISSNDIYYVDVPEMADTMTHILSINLDNEEIVEKSFLIGSSQTMYVSENNIFLATSHYAYYPMLLTRSGGSSDESTILHKISIHNGDVTYISQGEVPGRILNQFSMDEHNGFFRIATTVGYTGDTQTPSSNNIYILDENLKQISQIENIAPGESIYAARFMGDRAYLVTFVQVDPLFTVDLSDPYNPKILGELKIPGYSEYLHPYDEDHIIGIGKEVDPSIDADKIHTPGAIYYTAILGLKIALFDVSDFEHPQEIAKVVIGDRGTDSPALYDHKAFLFDKEKGLLVIPVSLYEIPQEAKDRYVASNGTETPFGQFTFQGAYVYSLTLENGFEYRGRITHQTQEETQKTYENWYWGSSNTDITRTLYIGNVLYTISGSMLKMNNLDDLSDINSVTFE